MGVCTDPCSLYTDDLGVTRMRISGDPDPKDWPYDCTLQNSNLRRDPSTGCLWVDPLARNLVTAVQGDQFPNVTLALNVPVSITDIANLSITNPDPCRAAAVWLGVWMAWTIDGDFDPTTNFGAMTLSRQITGAMVLPAEPGYVETYHDHTGTRSTMVVTARTEAIILGLGAGATTTVGLNMQATRNDGSMIWTRAQGRITAMLTGG